MHWIPVILLAAGLAAGQLEPPAKLVFPSKSGPVTYDHAAHLERAKRDCKVCHDKPWPQSAKTPVQSKDCKMCHQPNGAAFEMKGNCARCHAHS